MVFFLYSNKAYEHQAMACIKSLSDRVTDDIKIVYYTIGFNSDFEFKNLTKIPFPLKDQYPSFYLYLQWIYFQMNIICSLIQIYCILEDFLLII